MAVIVKPNTFTAGTTILSAQVNSNFDIVYALVNGNLDSTNFSASANIPDTMLAQLTTASKVHGSTLTGTLVTTKGADIASATTTDIGAATGNPVDVTGVTTITGLGTIAAGALRFVRFTGALLLTHNGTSLILPTGADITTAAGDAAIFESLGSGNWVCLFYQRKDGTSLSGAIATQAVMETATNNTNVVSPLAVKWHPGTAKAWCKFNGTGTPAMLVSHNMDSSITDNGSGDYTLSFTTDFSSGDYALAGMSRELAGNGGTVAIKNGTTPAAGSVNIIVSASDGGAYDSAHVSIIAFGDQ